MYIGFFDPLIYIGPLRTVSELGHYSVTEETSFNLLVEGLCFFWLIKENTRLSVCLHPLCFVFMHCWHVVQIFSESTGSYFILSMEVFFRLWESAATATPKVTRSYSRLDCVSVLLFLEVGEGLFKWNKWQKKSLLSGDSFEFDCHSTLTFGFCAAQWFHQSQCIY